MKKQVKDEHKSFNSSLPDCSREMRGRGHIPEKKRRRYKPGTLAFGARLALGVIFVYASIDKILNPTAFAQAVYNYRILPDLLINLTAIILPWMELLLGLCLILGLWLPGAVFLCTILLATFFGALLFNTARGLHIDCGCFSKTDGTPSEISMAWYVIRDGAFLLLALYLSFHVFFQKSPDQKVMQAS